MASKWFAKGIEGITKGTIDLSASTLKAVLLNSTGNAGLKFDTLVAFDSILTTWKAIAHKVTTNTAFAIVGSVDHVNYGSGSQVLTFTTVTTGQKAKGVVIFRSGATDAASELLCYNSFTSAVATDGTKVDVTLNASGFGRSSY